MFCCGAVLFTVLLCPLTQPKPKLIPTKGMKNKSADVKNINKLWIVLKEKFVINVNYTSLRSNVIVFLEFMSKVKWKENGLITFGHFSRTEKDCFSLNLMFMVLKHVKAIQRFEF